MLNSGDIAPDFTLTTAGGQILSLFEVLQSGQNALLVFLRHLG